MNDYTQDIKNIQLTHGQLCNDTANMEHYRMNVLCGVASYLVANYLIMTLDELDSSTRAINREKNDLQPIK